MLLANPEKFLTEDEIARFPNGAVPVTIDILFDEDDDTDKFAIVTAETPDETLQIVMAVDAIDLLAHTEEEMLLLEVDEYDIDED